MSKLDNVSFSDIKIFGRIYTVQLKDNLIPPCMLQVEYCWVKITSCIQYLNRHPLHSCPHQANCLACAPPNVTLILNKLLNETYNINSIYTKSLWISSLYVLIHPLSYWKAAHVQYISCPTVWLGVENGFDIENGFFIGDWISINLFEFIQSVGWKVRKYFIS